MGLYPLDESKIPLKAMHQPRVVFGPERVVASDGSVVRVPAHQLDVPAADLEIYRAAPHIDMVRADTPVPLLPAMALHAFARRARVNPHAAAVLGENHHELTHETTIAAMKATAAARAQKEVDAAAESEEKKRARTERKEKKAAEKAAADVEKKRKREEEKAKKAVEREVKKAERKRVAAEKKVEKKRMAAEARVEKKRGAAAREERKRSKRSKRRREQEEDEEEEEEEKEEEKEDEKEEQEEEKDEEVVDDEDDYNDDEDEEDEKDDEQVDEAVVVQSLAVASAGYELQEECPPLTQALVGARIARLFSVGSGDTTWVVGVVTRRYGRTRFREGYNFEVLFDGEQGARDLTLTADNYAEAVPGAWHCLVAQPSE